MDCGGPEEAGGPQLPAGAPGGGAGARRVQEGESAALRGRAASAREGQLQFAGQVLGKAGHQLAISAKHNE